MMRSLQLFTMKRWHELVAVRQISGASCTSYGVDSRRTSLRYLHVPLDAAHPSFLQSNTNEVGGLRHTACELHIGELQAKNREPPSRKVSADEQCLLFEVTEEGESTGGRNHRRIPAALKLWRVMQSVSPTSVPRLAFFGNTQCFLEPYYRPTQQLFKLGLYARHNMCWYGPSFPPFFESAQFLY
ncbi:hypothetical protein PsorP6_007419 [Peronosclerospora sorghi]|uniref:Uncharacterized protein n=1 Tax=Peronosclerospora sorghi TaxID=230839 RepID=A0ACC0W9G4_9STRA|nr:hypothetical protein PsorP6_007419 [Peronosclerospora sorghi]